MRIALVEWTQGGHHEIYLRTAASALASAGHEVWILHPEPEKVFCDVVQERPELAGKLKPFVLKPASRLIAASDARLRYMGKWRSVLKALRQIDVLEQPKTFDLVFFMFVDEFLAPLILPTWLDSTFPYAWAGLYMQPLFRLQETDAGRRPEMLRRDHLLRSRRFKGAVALDEASVPWLRERFSRPFEAIADFGDFAEAGRASARGAGTLGLFKGATDRGVLRLVVEAKRCA